MLSLRRTSLPQNSRARVPAPFAGTAAADRSLIGLAWIEGLWRLVLPPVAAAWRADQTSVRALVGQKLAHREFCMIWAARAL
jgi:hypothetical protein